MGWFAELAALKNGSHKFVPALLLSLIVNKSQPDYSAARNRMSLRRPTEVHRGSPLTQCLAPERDRCGRAPMQAMPTSERKKSQQYANVFFTHELRFAKPLRSCHNDYGSSRHVAPRGFAGNLRQRAHIVGPRGTFIAAHEPVHFHFLAWRHLT